MPVGEVQNLVNKLEVEVRGKVATPRVGLCALLLFLALLVSVNIGLTLWLLFTVRLDLVSPRFISCFVTLLWLWQKRSEICQNFFSERWGTSHLCPWGAQGGGLH